METNFQSMNRDCRCATRIVLGKRQQVWVSFLRAAVSCWKIRVLLNDLKASLQLFESL